MSINLRQATLADLEIINQIYNQAVSKRHQTADLVPIDMEQRHLWFKAHDKDQYVINVIENAGQVIGWSSLSKYREGREALRSTAEISYYIDSEYQGMGHGSYLLTQTMAIAKQNGFHNLVALLLSANTISIRILTKFGFQEWGRIPNAALIDNQRFDHLFYGRAIT